MSSIDKVVIGEKLRKIRSSRGFTQTELANKLEVKQQTVQQIEGGKIFPTIEIMEKITNIFCISFEDLLLTGDSEMLRSSFPSTGGAGVVSADTEMPNHKQADDIAVTRVSLDFVGGSAHNFLEQQQYVEEVLYLPKNWGIQQGDFAVNTVGESMYPYIIQGDTLILREVKDNIQNLILNKAYAFATEDQLAVKIIKKSAENSQKNLSFHSYNETAYPAFDLPKSAIKHVFKIIKVFGSR